MNVLVTDALWERLEPLLPPRPNAASAFPDASRWITGRS